MAGGGETPLLTRRLVQAVAIPLFAYLLYSTAMQALESRRMARQVEELQVNVEALREENVRQQNELNYRRSDLYVEEVAREQLGLVMPGDVAINLLGENVPPRHRPASPGPSTGAPNSVPEAQRVPFEAWLNFFFGV